MYRRTHLAAIADLGLEAGVAQNEVAVCPELDLVKVVLDLRGLVRLDELDVEHELGQAL